MTPQQYVLNNMNSATTYAVEQAQELHRPMFVIETLYGTFQVFANIAIAPKVGRSFRLVQEDGSWADCYYNARF